MKPSATDGSLLAGRFQRFLLRLVAQTREDLRTLPKHPERSIHRVRVRMKKFAAILRLVKARLPEEDYRTALERAKRLKNAFAKQRDAQVAAQLSGSVDRGRKKRPALPKQAPASLFIEAAILERFLAEAPFPGLRREDVLRAYVKCYRKGRKRMKECLNNADPKRLHQWRGPVKKFFYQSLALHRRQGAEKRIERARKLGKWLGKDHDWHLLAETALKANLPDKAEKYEAKRRKRQPQIFKLARKLYEDSPRELRRKLEKG